MNFVRPHFAEPAWLWLALLGPLLLFLLQRYAAAARRRQLSRLAAPRFVQKLTRSHSAAKREIKNVFLILAVIAMGLAMARPQWGEQANISHFLGQDVVFVLDCSRSMLASDVLPSRLQRAKLAILDFVQRRGHGRVGLVAFAGQAFLQCPLTFDYGAFREALSAIDDKTIPIPGTDIGRALDEGFHALKKDDRQKLLVIVTDGEDLEKRGVKMAEELGKKAVVIFTIGVGTAAGAEIQIVNEQGRPEFLRDSNGELVRSRLDEPTLRSIGQAAHGEYYPLGPLGEGLAKVRIAAETMDQSVTVPDRKLGKDRFHIPLAVALALLVWETLLGTRRRQEASEGRSPASP